MSKLVLSTEFGGIVNVNVESSETFIVPVVILAVAGSALKSRIPDSPLPSIATARAAFPAVMEAELMTGGVVSPPAAPGELL